MKKVVVIGGGLGGVSGAIRLAKMGFDVSLFEKNEHIGGKVNEYIEDGYRFDMGPSLITMPFVIKELIEFAGFEPDKLIDFQELDVICRYFYSDGKVIDAFADLEKMQNELAKLSPQDAEKYPDFLKYTKKIYDLTADLFLFEPFYKSNVIFRPSSFKTLFQINKIDAFRTVDEGVRRFFKDERVIQLFNRYATYNGSNPFEAPATLNIIPWVEYGLKSYYIKGGIYKLAEILEKIAVEVGVSIFKNSEVEEIICKKDLVDGVRVNGVVEKCDVILANSDVVETFRSLIKNNKTRQKVENLEPSLSGYVGLWGVKDNYEKLSHHNILFSEDYFGEFQTIFKKKQLFNDPSVYISITSKKEKNHSPADSENWFVLVNMPYVDKDQDFSKVDEIIFNKLKKFNLDIKDKIEVKRDLNPNDLYSLYRSNKGSIYGISSNDRNSAFLRPKNFSREFKNLFFAGGSSHPGGGVPLVILSGKIAANLINEKFG